MTHTPTPWTIHKVFADWNFPYRVQILRDETVIAELEGGKVSCFASSLNDKLNSECLANAQHIVHCVNSHAALVEALRSTTASLIAASDLLEQGGKKAAPSDRMFRQMLKDYRDAIETGRNALAQAEKGA